jgi:hypothetical protein
VSATGWIIVLVFVIGVIATCWVLAASENTRLASRFRERVLERFDQLPFRAMLTRRGTDPDDYADATDTEALAEQMALCERCESHGACQAALAAGRPAELDRLLPTCPNAARIAGSRDSAARPSQRD